MHADQLIDQLRSAVTNKDDAVFLQRFFKTGSGQYGEGDIFIGVRMPKIRQVCRQFSSLSIIEINKLLASKIHEVRMAGLIIMSMQMTSKATSVAYKKTVFNNYLKHSDKVNNWDLVDVSCRAVLGSYLYDKPRDILYKLARSNNLWERRMAIVSTWYFISKGDFADTLKIAKILQSDSHDLIHKAIGWMLREVGKKDRSTLLKFLDENAAKMPRTALRYAIEHLSHEQRLHYMAQKTLL